MSPAPLIIVVAGIARVTSRIVRGVGQEKRAGDHRGRTPPRKIRARFQACKHILLIFVVSTFDELRLCGVIGSSGASLVMCSTLCYTSHTFP